MTEEMPPAWMWPLTEDLDDWFEEVDRKRKERYGGSDDEEEGPDMLQNELALDLRRK